MQNFDRIPTTHTGSLPRPPAVMAPGGVDDEAVLAEAVNDIVRQQVAAGMDFVSDGEMSKPSYVGYVADVLTGFGDTSESTPPPDVVDFPQWGAFASAAVAAFLKTPACIGDVQRRDLTHAQRDIARLQGAVAQSGGSATPFMTAASPGVIAMFMDNRHYASHDDYLAALAAAMKLEYDEIHRSGLMLQIDCPDLAAGRVFQFPDATLDEWQATAADHIEVLNEATRDIPAEAMRMHLCWGNYAGPHIHDVPLRDVLPFVYKARPAAISFEAANPRHAHEWEVFADLPLPDDKMILPGVVDSTSPFVEHPELIAQRLIQFAQLVGKERVVASTDCGFATFAPLTPVMSEIVFAKLAAISEGAALASDKLW